MEYFNEALDTILYEDKQTDDEEKFGIYRVPSLNGCVEFVKLYTNIAYKPHIHDKADAKFYFLKGSGFVILGKNKFPYQVGSVYEAPAGVLHGFEIIEDTIFLSVQSNPIQDRITGVIDIRYE